MTRSKKLVVVDASGQVVTTSLKIAEGTDNEHKSIIRLISEYKDRFERFGQIYFSDLKSPIKSIDTADNDKPRLSSDRRMQLCIVHSAKARRLKRRLRKWTGQSR